MAEPSNHTPRQKYERRKEALKSMRQPWEEQWQELADYIAPTRLRRTVTAPEGKKLRSKIVDSSGSFALRTLASGMHSGITSPARPWFRLSTFDPELKEYAPVKEYMFGVETRMREVFQASNIYNSFHQGYGDLGLMGQSCGILVEDRESVIRMQQLLHGSFWLARDHRGIATTLLREFSWSVERIVARFTYAKCSYLVQRCYDRGDYDERFTINHIIEPRHERDRSKIDKANKPFASCYWEEGARGQAGDTGQMLEVSGFDENPIIAPAWELIAEDHYAYSPGMDALPDVKMLQVEQRDKVNAIAKKVNPPLKGPTSLKNNPSSTLPGSITYVDDPTGRGYTSTYDVNVSISELAADIRETQARVERAFYADLFLMLTNMEGIQPRNEFEIAERKEEKLLALGPVLENIYGGQLEPTIDRTFAIMERTRGMLPPPPPELQGQTLKVEYTSMLAQAQKAVSTGAIDRTWAFAGRIAAAVPDVLDKMDADQSVDEYADALGAPPAIIVSDDKVKAIREGRAQAQQQAQQAEQMAMMAPAMRDGAEAAKVLSERYTGTSGSLLNKLGIG